CAVMSQIMTCVIFSFLNVTPPTAIYTLSLHDALPIFFTAQLGAKRLELLRELVPKAKTVAVLVNPDNPPGVTDQTNVQPAAKMRSEEHTSELQSRGHLVCRLLLEKKNQPLN